MGKPVSAEELCQQADPRSEVEHLIVCPVCGQIFDCRESEQVAHHDTPDHGALKPSRR